MAAYFAFRVFICRHGAVIQAFGYSTTVCGFAWCSGSPCAFAGLVICGTHLWFYRWLPVFWWRPGLRHRGHLKHSTSWSPVSGLGDSPSGAHPVPVSSAPSAGGTAGDATHSGPLLHSTPSYADVPYQFIGRVGCSGGGVGSLALSPSSTMSGWSKSAALEVRPQILEMV